MLEKLCRVTDEVLESAIKIPMSKTFPKTILPGCSRTGFGDEIKVLGGVSTGRQPELSEEADDQIKIGLIQNECLSQRQ